MKKLTILCLSLVVGLGSMLAAVPRRTMGTAPVQLSNSGLKTLPSMLRHRAAGSTNLPTFNASAQKSILPANMLKAGPTGSTIYGWLVYSNSSSIDNGLTEVYASNGNYTPAAFDSQYSIASAFIRQGKVYAYGTMGFMGFLMANAVLEYDMETGELVNSTALSVSDHSQDVVTATYDPAADKVYGYCLTADGTAYQFFSAPASDPTQFTYSPTSDMCSSITWNQVESKLVGITLNGNNLVEINPANGQMTTLAKAPVQNLYASGLCFSPNDNAYIWNPNEESRTYLYKISVPDYSFTKITDYNNCENFISFFCTDSKAIDPKAPATPEITNVILGREEPQALIMYNIPSTTFDGTPIEGRIDYEATVDGNYYTDGTVAPGQENFMINFVDVTEGEHTFSLTLSLEGKESVAASRILYVGNDTPLAPQNVVLTEEGISWDAVTDGVHGGVVDTDVLTYTIAIDGKEIASGVADTHYDYTLPEGELAIHRASVVAVCNGHTSAAGLSNGMVSGNPLNLPATITPTQDQYDLCSIIDSNNDERTFFLTQDNNGDNVFAYIFSAQLNGDDWAVMPPMSFPDADKIYRLTLKAASSNADSPEAFEVYIGSTATAAGMTKCVMERTDVVSTEYVEYSALFQVPAAGSYYVGLHAVSNADSYYLFMRDIKVEATAITGNAPAAVTAVTATPDAKGELKATVAFKMPVKSIDGNDLPASEQLTATLKSQAGTATVEGTPGQNVSAEVATLQGDNTISITVSSATAGEGAQTSVNVHTGVDRPGTVNNLLMQASEDDMTLHLTWEPPTEGATGGYCPPTGLTYYLCEYDSNNGWTIGDVIGTDVLTHDITLPADARQTLYRYGVVAENQAGRADYLTSAMCIAGVPWSMPFTENLANNSYRYGPITVMRPDETYNMSWNITDPSVLGQQFVWPDAGALIGCSEDSNASKGIVSLGKVSTEGSKNARFNLTFFYGLGGDIEVLLAGYEDMEPVSIGKVSDLNSANLVHGYNEVSFPIPAKYQNRKWIQPYFRATVENGSQAAIIPVYGISEVFASDLAVKLNIPSCIYLDKKATVKAVVKNDGTEPTAMRSGKWLLTTKDGREIASEAVEADGTTLQPGETRELTFSFTPDTEYGQQPKISFALDTNDDNASNDKAQEVLWMYITDTPVVLDLRGVDSGDDYIDLAWTEPSMGKIKASFENEPVGEELPVMIEDFTNIDGDDAQVWGVQNMPYFLKAAFSVWSLADLNDAIGIPGAFDEYAGDKVLVAACPGSAGTDIAPKADDWLISPKVKGGSTVRFGIRCIDYTYPETIELMYSTTDDNTDSFTVLKSFTTDLGIWETVEAELPEDAKYFALHYVSQDQYAILVDGIEFQADLGSGMVVAYDILRNNEVIAPSAKAEGYYRDATIEDRDAVYAYNIVPILGNGIKGRMSNTVLIQASGVNEVTGNRTLVYTAAGTIHATGFEGAQLSLYSVDGALLNTAKGTAHNTFRVQPGIYLLNSGKKSYKVQVK